MKERKQKTLSQVNGCPQRDRSETEWYGEVHTFMWMCEDNIVDVPFDKEHLFEQILSSANLSRAYKAVMRNKGCGGIDKMSCEQLLPWLLTNKDLLIRSLMDGSYRPNPVKRVEIPKDNGKMRLLGIPTVVDRLVQQAINQVLTSIYENQFSKTSYGFRPRRGCHDALRGAQRIINEGYIYVVDLDLERFFDTVSHSKLIEILCRTIKDDRVVSLIHKYLRSGVMNKGLFEASEEGTPQGGPLSPLLSNIVLNKLDKELERRGLPFCALCRRLDDILQVQKGSNASQGEHNLIYRGNSISKSQQGKNRSVVCARSEISRLLLLCDERQMPARGASQVQSQDEVKFERTDKSQQRMGICQEKTEAERIHTRVGRLLSPCQYEASSA